MADGAEPHAATSIHALLAESDKAGSYKILPQPELLSTLSLRRATRLRSIWCNYTLQLLSTLSLRRATSIVPLNLNRIFYFYPRSPCGERQQLFYFLFRIPLFYPRSPCGERLYPALSCRPHAASSIHALLAESDSGACNSRLIAQALLSTLSLRRATHLKMSDHPHNTLLSTLSLRRATDSV